ncbi:MAG: hypothetical protein HC824_02940 [Synechococcales cyanobacterium RM1_1_8]|nr:hypothetical protein [Synechococcales cyanobacterium RM1_1_8]
MKPTQESSSDWMMMIAILLVATLIGAVMSPQPGAEPPQTAHREIR